MSTIIDELWITLGLDGSKAKQGMNEAVSGIQKGANQIISSLKGVTAAFAGLYGVQSAFRTYLAEADALGKFSDSIGQNIEDIHAWQEAVKRSGGTAEGFQGSIKGLSSQLMKQSITGNSRTAKILEGMGIDAGTVGQARDVFDVLGDVADRMKDMSALEATSFGQLLGLDAGMIALLRQGRDATKDMIRNQKELGVYTKEDARVTAELNDTIEDSKQAFISFAAIIFRMITPAMTSIVKVFTNAISYLRKHEVAVQTFFTGLALAITVYFLPTIARATQALYRFAAAALANPWTWLVVGLVALSIAVEDLYTWMEGGEAAFGDFWEALFGSPEEAKKTWEEWKKTGEETLTFLKEAWKGFWEFVGAGTEAQEKSFDNSSENMELLFGDTTKSMGEGFKDFKEVCSTLWDGFVAIVIDGNDEMKQNEAQATSDMSLSWDKFVQNAIGENSMLSQSVDNMTQAVNDLIEDATSYISELWTDMSNTAVDAVMAIIGPIQAVASAIYEYIGGAVQWAMDRWADLKAAVGMGDSSDTPRVSTAASRAAGSISNATTWNVTMNGIANGSQAVSTFKQGVGPKYSMQQANAGIRG